MNSMSEYRDSEDIARVGFLRFGLGIVGGHEVHTDVQAVGAGEDKHLETPAPVGGHGKKIERVGHDGPALRPADGARDVVEPALAKLIEEGIHRWVVGLQPFGVGHVLHA
jgi:hypothetical protein